MGIATIRSYCGAQIFEAVGLDRELVDRYFAGTPSAVGGVGLARARPRGARAPRARLPRAPRRSLPEHVEDSLLPAAHAKLLPQGGVYAWRRDGERHAWDPETIAALQLAAHRATERRRRAGAASATRSSAERVNEENGALAMLRGLLELTPAGDPIPIEEVEPATEILKRFTTGGMSLGRSRPEAHETLAVAMNRIGGMSNSRRGRRGHPPLHARPERRPAPLADQAGRLGPLRRHRPLPLLGRPDPDQDRPGREARRGRPAARPQGRPLHRPAALRDPGRRADLAPAPPRHLLDRGPQAADLRPPRGQPDGDRLGQARRRGRGRHGRRRGRQGGRRPRRDRRPRRRHRRLAAVVDPAGGRALGDRPRRDPADAASQRPALADRGPGRRRHAHRPRRDHRGDARRRRVRLLDRAPDRDRLHHDARLPPQHLPGRGGDPGPGAARPLRRQARARRQLPLSWSPRTSAATSPRSGSRGSRTRSAGSSCSPRTPEPEGHKRRLIDLSDLLVVPPQAIDPPRAAPPHPRARAARPALRRARAAHRGHGRDRGRTSRCGSSAGSPTSTGPSAPGSPTPLVARHGPRGCPTTRSRSRSAARPDRASAPGSPPGSRSTLEGEANDYVGKGLSGGVARRPPAGRRRASAPRRT